MVSVDEAIDNVVKRKADKKLGRNVGYYIARKRQAKAAEEARREYLATVFRRDTPLPLPSVLGLTIATVPYERLEDLGYVAHRQLAELARLEMDLRMVGGGC